MYGNYLRNLLSIISTKPGCAHDWVPPYTSEHRATLMTMHSLATFLQRKGDLAAAEPLTRETLALRQRVLGDDDPDTWKSMSDLAYMMLNKGDLVAGGLTLSYSGTCSFCTESIIYYDVCVFK